MQPLMPLYLILAALALAGLGYLAATLHARHQINGLHAKVSILESSARHTAETLGHVREALTQSGIARRTAESLLLMTRRELAADEEALGKLQACALNQRDLIALLAIAKTLGRASAEFAKRGSSKSDPYQTAATQLRAIAERVERHLKGAGDTLSDTDLIEWLNQEAACEQTGAMHAAIEFQGNWPTAEFHHLRDALRDIVRNHQAERGSVAA